MYRCCICGKRKSSDTEVKDDRVRSFMLVQTYDRLCFDCAVETITPEVIRNWKQWGVGLS
jgi:hypothetical protein